MKRTFIVSLAIAALSFAGSAMAQDVPMVPEGFEGPIFDSADDFLSPALEDFADAVSQKDETEEESLNEDIFELPQGTYLAIDPPAEPTHPGQVEEADDEDSDDPVAQALGDAIDPMGINPHVQPNFDADYSKDPTIDAQIAPYVAEVSLEVNAAVQPGFDPALDPMDPSGSPDDVEVTAGPGNSDKPNLEPTFDPALDPSNPMADPKADPDFDPDFGKVDPYVDGVDFGPSVSPNTDPASDPAPEEAPTGAAGPPGAPDAPSLTSPYGGPSADPMGSDWY